MGALCHTPTPRAPQRPIPPPGPGSPAGLAPARTPPGPRSCGRRRQPGGGGHSLEEGGQRVGGARRAGGVGGGRWGVWGAVGSHHAAPPCPHSAPLSAPCAALGGSNTPQSPTGPPLASPLWTAPPSPLSPLPPTAPITPHCPLTAAPRHEALQPDLPLHVHLQGRPLRGVMWGHRGSRGVTWGPTMPPAPSPLTLAAMTTVRRSTTSTKSSLRAGCGQRGVGLVRGFYGVIVGVPVGFL